MGYVVFTSPDGQYYVTIGLKKKDSAMVITGRNEAGTGDMKAAGTIDVLGVKVKRTEEIYKNQVKGYIYPEMEAFSKPPATRATPSLLS